MSKINGGCLGGAARYRSNADPKMVMACHCRIRPNAHTCCSEKQPWVELPAGVACLDQGPE